MPDTIDNLSDLLEAIKAGIYNDVEMSSLPNFGGDEPPCTVAVWSWDDENILVGEGIDDMVIITRAEWAGDLHDYTSGDNLRPATEAQFAESMIAAESDDGVGVIMVDGKSCYVA